MALQLFSTAIWYCGGDPGEGWERNEGVQFWQVGRNASHSFYMGVRRDAEAVRFFRGSYDPDQANCPREGTEPEDAWEQSEVKVFKGYYGHA
jgi:hypothetical protein